jgi:DNA-binding XRE family transcriptional regulator
MTTRFGDLIANRRIAYGFRSQSALAKAANVSPQTIMDIESGVTEWPKLETALSLCNLLEITPNEMAAHFGMWHGKSLENDRLSKQLSMTLSNLEMIADSLDPRGQEVLDATLSTIVRGFNPHNPHRQR